MNKHFLPLSVLLLAVIFIWFPKNTYADNTANCVYYSCAGSGTNSIVCPIVGDPTDTVAECFTSSSYSSACFVATGNGAVQNCTCGCYAPAPVTCNYNNLTYNVGDTVSCTGPANVCGQTNNSGTAICQSNGSMSCSGGTAPPLTGAAANYGNSCSSPPNACNQTTTGTYDCNDNCSAGTTPPPLTGAAANYGNPCTSGANSCGQTNAGTYTCTGTCSASTPPNSSCSCSGSASAGCTCGQTKTCNSGSWSSCGGPTTPVNGTWSFSGSACVDGVETATCQGASCGGTCSGSAPTQSCVSACTPSEIVSCSPIPACDGPYTCEDNCGNVYGMTDAQLYALGYEGACGGSSSVSISLSPNTLTFSGVSGGSAPAGQTFTVTNSGTSGPLIWHATTDASWCSVNGKSNGAYFNGASLSSGSTSPNLTVTMGVHSDTGSQICHVTVSDNGSSPAASNSPQQVTVTYKVSPSDVCSGASCGTCVKGACGGSPMAVTASLATCPATGVVLNWPAAQSGSQPVSYNVYRGSTSNSAAANLVAGSPFSGTTYSGPLNVGVTKYYWVQAVSNGLTSPDLVASNPASITGAACSGGSGSGNLSASQKDIISINNNVISPTPGQCNGNDALPANTTINLGDTLGFQINLCNANTGTSSNISITDTMINLIVPTSGWNMQYNGTPLTLACPANASNQYCVYGTAPDQDINVNLSSTVIGPSGGGHLTYSANTSVPASFTGSIARFQNTFYINYASTSNMSILSATTGNTPLLPFYVSGGNPTIHEIP